MKMTKETTLKLTSKQIEHVFSFRGLNLAEAELDNYCEDDLSEAEVTTIISDSLRRLMKEN